MSSNAGTVASFLQSKGLSNVAIAGVLGNLQVESGLNPTAYNPNEKAIGLAQWELGRRTNLQAFAAKKGGKETDLNVQLAFLWSELTGGYSGALANLKKATTPAEAATIWDSQFEHSAGTSRGARIAAAQKFAGNMPSTGGLGSGILDALKWTTPTGAGVAAAEAVGNAGSVTGALGLPSTSDIGGAVTKAGVYLIAFALGGGLLVIGLNKASGNPAGKIAGAASKIPIPV